MNILLINHYAGAPSLGMEYRPYYLAREWVKSGHRVSIVAASHSHVRTVQPKKSSPIVRENLDGIDYYWLPTPRYGGNGLGRILNMTAFVARLFFGSRYFSEKIRPDLVIASSTYPLDIFPARKIALSSGARLAFEVHDLWPLSPMELGNMPPWHPFIMVMQMAENHAYRYADKVVSMLPAAFDHMTSHGMAPDKFVHIPNGVSMTEWTGDAEPLPESHKSALRELRESKRLIVGYAGGHGVSNALDAFVNSAPLVESAGVSLVLVGKGLEKERLEQMIKSNKISNIKLLDPVPKRAIPSLLREMDILFLGWKRQPLYRFGICPNKLMDYMMAAKPVIHAVEAANDLVKDCDCGLSIEPESPEAIAKAILVLISDGSDEWEAMGARGRAFVKANHDYRILAERFLKAVM